MKRWHWWALATMGLIVIVAILMSNRYSMECVALVPRQNFPLAPGQSSSGGATCYVLDRWTGDVTR